jgi:hypothetical protein
MTADCVGRAMRADESSADPTKAFDAARRYLAARCWALAGCGTGEDGDKLSEAERTHARQPG